ncbi:hypothetical protein GBJ12_06545, partial [Bifidobacterium longum]
FVSVASGHLTLLAVGQVLQRSLEPAESDGLGGGEQSSTLVSSPQSSTMTAPLKEGSQNHLVHEGG